MFNISWREAVSSKLTRLYPVIADTNKMINELTLTSTDTTFRSWSASRETLKTTVKDATKIEYWYHPELATAFIKAPLAHAFSSPGYLVLEYDTLANATSGCTVELL